MILLSELFENFDALIMILIGEPSWMIEQYSLDI